MTAKPQSTYEIYVEDDRYGVPTLHLVMAHDEGEAREVLERLLRENAHHRGGEIWKDGQVLHRAGSFAVTRRPTRASEGNGQLSSC